MCVRSYVTQAWGHPVTYLNEQLSFQNSKGDTVLLQLSPCLRQGPDSRGEIRVLCLGNRLDPVYLVRYFLQLKCANNMREEYCASGEGPV